MAESQFRPALMSNNTTRDRCYCHTCKIEVETTGPDYLCPRCNKGFIEILCDYQVDSDSEPSDDDEFNVLHLPNYPRNPPSESSPSSSSGTRRNQHMQRLNPRHTRRRVSMDRQTALTPLLHDLIMQMSSGVLAANVGSDYRLFPGAGAVEIPMLISSSLASNPGDYAWGRGGLDTIITQLMNQLDSTGPPPLSQDKIDLIPEVKITKEQCDINLQCSVCMEDFQLDESVRQLNCEHCYHNACIIPWLELHGTCPVCRKSLTEGRACTNTANLTSLLSGSRMRAEESTSSGSNNRPSNSSESVRRHENRPSTSHDSSSMLEEDLD